MEKRELTCICCPMGCPITVEMKDGEISSVTGFTCKRGEAYAKREVTNPTRIVTSSVPVEGGRFAMLPVKTASDVPKGSIFDCMASLKGLRVQAPVRIGDVVCENAGGTGVSFIACRNIPAC